MPVHLIYSEVIAKARAAYLDGTLQAIAMEGLRTKDGGCNYTGCCAIGASLTPDQRDDFDHAPATPIRYLLASGVVTTDDREALIHLQSVHDRCTSMEARERYLPQLRALLGIDEEAPA